MQTDTLRALNRFESGLEANLGRLELLPDLIDECLEAIDPDDQEEVVALLQGSTMRAIDIAKLHLMMAL